MKTYPDGPGEPRPPRPTYTSPTPGGPGRPRPTLPLLLLLLICLTGCRGFDTQKYTAYPPAKAVQLEADSKIVVDVKCTKLLTSADYTLGENLLMTAPHAKKYKSDAAFAVQRVIKGDFTGKEIIAHYLREPTLEQCNVLGIVHQPLSFTNDMRFRIGFDKISPHSGKLRNLRIVFPPSAK